MKLYYRISDNSYDKPKLPGASKEICFMNFVKAFHSVIFRPGEPSSLTIIADKCSPSTLAWLEDTKLPMLITEHGNAGSLLNAINLAIQDNPDNEFVYFCEDDYLHLGVAPVLLAEGSKRSDYVTLYDHPDKYTRNYDMGEISKVVRTASSHWRYTISTCMTFGTKIKTLKEDYEIWKEFTSDLHPWDHEIFQKLKVERNRRLALCIPGAACHIDLTVSAHFRSIMLEPWAIEMMSQELNSQIRSYIGSAADGDSSEAEDLLESMTKGKEGWSKLIAQDAFLQQIKLDAQK